MNANNPVANFYRASAEDFKKIPGSSVAYWVSDKMLNLFITQRSLSPVAKPCVGLQTGDNDRFVRFWHETETSRIYFKSLNREEARNSRKKWFPYNKGGEYRKWYGNQENVVNWLNDGKEIRNFKDEKGKLRSRPQNMEYYLKYSISWSKISSGFPAFRYYPPGFIYDVAGTSIFTNEEERSLNLIGYCNSLVVRRVLNILSPTLNFEVGHIASLPFNDKMGEKRLVSCLINISKSDWDSYETSWDFTDLPLLTKSYFNPELKKAWQSLRSRWIEATLEMQRLEEENNRIFISAYGLEEELTPDVPLEEITLTCNPYYRYGTKVKEAETASPPAEMDIDTAWPWNSALEERLQSDTIKELLSYAVGCIFGRYSLDKPGLVLANAGEGIDDYLEQVPNPAFMPDRDGILPVTEEDDFPDDLAGRFRDFLKLTFGEEHFLTNLRFIEEALGKDIRSYFLRDFYKDHVRRYKNRPIYWMISSPKGSFRCLIYLHRYTRNTVGLFLDNYLRPYQRKLEAKEQNLEHIMVSPSAGTAEKARARKLQEKLRAVKNELELWQRDVVYPLATQRIELDLDDGVKVNYGKLGVVLEKVKGLNG